MWRSLEKVYSIRGFIVLGHERPRKIGEILTRIRDENGIVRDLPQPFRIVARATVQEYQSQNALGGYPPYELQGEQYFYRAITE